MSYNRTLAVLGLGLLVGPILAGQPAGTQAQVPAAAAPPSAALLGIEVVAGDKDGRPPDSLQPADLAVTVDGKPRTIVGITRVSRGPGAATDAAQRQARQDGPAGFAAEPVRNILVLVDQAALVRGEERVAIQAGGGFVDRLGIADRVAVLRLPTTGDQRVELTNERPASREALALVVGQATRTDAARPEAIVSAADRDRNLGVDPDRVSEPEKPKQEQLAVPDPGVSVTDADPGLMRTTLAGLIGLLRSMQSVPGRKVVALFSAGLTSAPPPQLVEAAVAAAAARATVYAFGLAGVHDDPRALPDISALQTLAKNTGGSFVMLGKNPARALDRVITELSASFVVDLQPAAGDGDGKRHALRVTTARKDVTVRSAAWLMPAPDAEDEVPPRPEADAAPAAGAGRAAEGAPAAKPGAIESRPVPVSEKDAELMVALARMFEYVEAYERQYSALVAEEEFQQVAGQKSMRLRSDFLLVKPDTTEGWVSFRDVFEVDGVPVRDREDRLKRLFLEPGLQSEAQLMQIKEESARYNIGPIERNINVPLFQLKFLSPVNRTRSRFKLSGRTEAAGVQAWRIEFTERDRPTIVKDRAEKDVPVSGSFLVEQGTGAIVETHLKVEASVYQVEISVKYRLDPGLGMWVPARMTEIYRLPRSTSLNTPMSAVSMGTAMEGTATYSRFRRFQVKTEETVTIPKK